MYAAPPYRHPGRVMHFRRNDRFGRRFKVIVTYKDVENSCNFNAAGDCKGISDACLKLLVKVQVVSRGSGGGGFFCIRM